MFYVVIDIGCKECGLSSFIRGIFTDKSKAEELQRECYPDYNPHRHAQVFEVAVKRFRFLEALFGKRKAWGEMLN